MSIELLIILLTALAITAVITYLIIGLAIAVDGLIYLHINKESNRVTIGRIIKLILFWFPMYLKGVRDE